MSLGPSASGYAPAGTRNRRRRGRFRYLLLLLLLGCGIGLYWIARDTVEPHIFVSKDSKFTATITDPLAVKSTFASSKIWEAVHPLNSDVATIQEALAAPIPLPPWALNHILNHQLYIFGNQSSNLDSAIMITRMTGFGVILERGVKRFSDEVQSDAAGGLNLRFIPDLDMYYAVRGRILLLSKDRAGLIQSLSLRSDDAIDQAQYDARLAGASEGALYIQLKEQESLPWLSAMDTALRLNNNTVEALSRLQLSEEWQERLKPLIAGAEPGPLQVVPESPLNISLNTKLTTQELVRALDTAYDPTFVEDRWAGWTRIDDSTAPWTLANLFTMSLQNCKGGISLALTDADPNEIMPIPILHLYAQGRRPEFGEAPETFTDNWPVYSDDGYATLPMPGGQSFQPRIWPREQSVAISNATSPATFSPDDEPGNLLITIEPQQVCELIRIIGQPWADQGLIAGHTRQSFDAMLDGWNEQAAPFATIRIHAAVEPGAIVLRTRLELR